MKIDEHPEMALSILKESFRHPVRSRTHTSLVSVEDTKNSSGPYYDDDGSTNVTL